MLTFLYALSLGFIGSFHCVGMCGPIALTLPVQHLNGVQKQVGILLYNAGRVSTYSLIGLVSGWIGRQFVLSGLQQWLSILLGVCMLLLVTLQPLLRTPVYHNGIKTLLGRLLRKQQFSTLYAIGFLNALLPCGLIYFALSGAIATGALLSGALFMAAFGIGTLPAMVAVSWFGHLISLRLRNNLRKCVPFVVSIMAILLIIRGLNVSHTTPGKTTIHCHKSF